MIKRFVRLGIGLFVLSPLSLDSQTPDLEVFATSGSNSGNYNSWTIGEVFVETLLDGNLLLSEGYHQPHVSLTGIAKTAPDLQVNIFPNPTRNKCFLEFSGTQPGAVNLELTSLMGKVVFRKNDQSPLKTIELDLSSLADGMYLLSISTRGNQPNSWFRIEKID